MKTKKAKKKPNMQDATLKNIRALKKRVGELEAYVNLRFKLLDTALKNAEKLKQKLLLGDW